LPLNDAAHGILASREGSKHDSVVIRQPGHRRLLLRFPGVFGESSGYALHTGRGKIRWGGGLWSGWAND